MGEDFGVCQSCHDEVVRDYGDYIQCDECGNRQCEGCEICRDCYPECLVCINLVSAKELPESIRQAILNLLKNECYCDQLVR
jgi:hypothetical protein